METLTKDLLFTVDGQEENHISWSTTQKKKHPMYKNITISVGGLSNRPFSYSVWQEINAAGRKRSRQIACNITLDQAIEIGNNLLMNDPK